MFSYKLFKSWWIQGLSRTCVMKFKGFQAPVLFSSTFKALNLGEKIQVLSRMRGNPDGTGISWSTCKPSAPHLRQITKPATYHSTFTSWILFRTINQRTEGNNVKYCDWHVCVLVSMSVCYSRISVTTCPCFTILFVRVTCGRGSILLWRHCSILCITPCFHKMEPTGQNEGRRDVSSSSPGGGTIRQPHRRPVRWLCYI